MARYLCRALMVVGIGSLIMFMGTKSGVQGLREFGAFIALLGAFAWVVLLCSNVALSTSTTQQTITTESSGGQAKASEQ